ncbi:MAG TPA: response regulator [Pyrinomonadaceae bacterium]|nr:response regulator [Pyrinomonadaceae bacterium]
MFRSGQARTTVLVADDFEDSRLVLRLMLEASEYRVIEASDGREAVESVRRERPDLVLMDLNMPHVDGLAATKQIRECQDACRDVPIVAVTAFDTYGMREAAMEAGCDDYVARPFDLERLESVLRRCLMGW